MSNSSAKLLLVCACLLTTQVPAQSSSASSSTNPKLTAEQLVDHLVENAETYRAALPSLTAHETILSKASVFLAFRDETVHAEATMRVMRKIPDGPLEESRQFTAIDGKLPAAGKPVALPLQILGAFYDFPTLFFAREHLQCFAFVLAPHPRPDIPLVLSISVAPQAAALPQCSQIQADMTATANIDPSTHQLIHLERTYPADLGKTRIVFMEIDLAPIKIGQKTFWLPNTLTAHALNGKIRLEMVSHYSDYHQFTATSTIVPAGPA